MVLGLVTMYLWWLGPKTGLNHFRHTENITFSWNIFFEQPILLDISVTTQEFIGVQSAEADFLELWEMKSKPSAWLHMTKAKEENKEWGFAIKVSLSFQSSLHEDT